MKKTITKEKVVVAYSFLMAASLKGMDRLGKFAVIRICQELKPVASRFEEMRQAIISRLKPEDYDVMQSKAAFLSKTGGRNAEVDKYFEDYTANVNKCIEEMAAEEQVLEYRELSEEQLGSLLDANESWTVEQMMLAKDLLMN